MMYRIELSAQGSQKPFAYHERPTKAQAHDLANRLRKRHATLTVTVFTGFNSAVASLARSVKESDNGNL